jgi:protoheme ferro-lyase
MQERAGVLLLSYGSPSDDADIPRYLASVRQGRSVSQELITDVQQRYRRIGGSPLLEITQAQADALQAHLASRVHSVRVAMLHSHPAIDLVISDFVDEGVDDVIAIVMSPQVSPVTTEYARALNRACSGLDAPPDVQIVGPWYDFPPLPLRATTTAKNLPMFCSQRTVSLRLQPRRSGTEIKWRRRPRR